MGRNNDNFIDLDWDFLEGDDTSSKPNNETNQGNPPSRNQESNNSSNNKGTSSSGSSASRDDKDQLRSKNKSEGLYNSSIDDIDGYWDYYLDKLEEIMNLSPAKYKTFINQLKMPLYGGKWNSFEKDRLRFFLAYMALRYSDIHYYETEFFENPEPYTEILDSIDRYINEMKERTDEAEFLYFVANMYSADRFEGVDPMEKLNEFWNELQGCQLNDNITEFKSDYWVEKAQNTYNYMVGLLQPSDEDNGGSASSNNSLPNSDKHDIFERVKKILLDKLPIDSSEINLNARLKEDFGADSLDAMELIMEFEKEFDIIIPEEDARRILTVGNAIDYIKTHV